MDWLLDVGTFGLKVLVITLALLVVVAVLTRFAAHPPISGSLRVRSLNRRVTALTDSLRRVVMKKRAFRKFLKNRAAQDRQVNTAPRPSLFVLTFAGDLTASAVHELRHEITAVLGVAKTTDEVVVRLESTGGFVHAYGLAASQLQRLRDHQIRLVVCVDRVAASGGYMMACVADRLLAAPFAVIGSIGVVTPVPNIHRLLEQHGVDYEEMTAGEFKRTVSFLGKINEKGRRKLQEQLEETHELFKQFVAQHRPAIDLHAVSSGEYWFAQRARDRGLVDDLITSDDYLVGKTATHDVLEVRYRRPRSWSQRVARLVGDEGERVAIRLWERLGLFTRLPG